MGDGGGGGSGESAAAGCTMGASGLWTEPGRTDLSPFVRWVCERAHIIYQVQFANDLAHPVSSVCPLFKTVSRLTVVPTFRPRGTFFGSRNQQLYTAANFTHLYTSTRVFAASFLRHRWEIIVGAVTHQRDS